MTLHHGRKKVFVIGAIATACFTSGCGEGESATDGLEAVVERVPQGDVPGIIAIDLVAAKEVLGLPADADPSEGFELPRSRVGARGSRL